MKENNFIETKIEQALNSLNKIEHVSTSPYFYSKVLQKLERPKETIVDKWNAWILTPSISFATLFLILLINAFVIIHNVNNTKSTEQNTVALSEEYTQSTDLSFYLESQKP